MAILFSDDWSSGSINATNWTNESGQYNVSAGEVRCSQAAQRHLKTTTSAHAAIADVYVETRRASLASFDAGVVVRSSITGSTANVGSCYILNLFATDSWDLIRRVTNVNTSLASGTSTHTDGDLFGLRVTTPDASTVLLEVFIKGVLISSSSYTNAARITAAGQTGLWSFASNSFMDDFSVSDLVSAGTGMVVPSNRLTLAAVSVAANF